MLCLLGEGFWVKEVNKLKLRATYIGWYLFKFYLCNLNLLEEHIPSAQTERFQIFDRWLKLSRKFLEYESVSRCLYMSQWADVCTWVKGLMSLCESMGWCLYMSQWADLSIWVSGLMSLYESVKEEYSALLIAIHRLTFQIFTSSISWHSEFSCLMVVVIQTKGFLFFLSFWPFAFSNPHVSSHLRTQGSFCLGLFVFCRLKHVHSVYRTMQMMLSLCQWWQRHSGGSSVVALPSIVYIYLWPCGLKHREFSSLELATFYL